MSCDCWGFSRPENPVSQESGGIYRNPGAKVKMTSGGTPGKVLPLTADWK